MEARSRTRTQPIPPGRPKMLDAVPLRNRRSGTAAALDSSLPFSLLLRHLRHLLIPMPATLIKERELHLDVSEETARRCVSSPELFFVASEGTTAVNRSPQGSLEGPWAGELEGTRCWGQGKAP